MGERIMSKKKVYKYKHKTKSFYSKPKKNHGEYGAKRITGNSLTKTQREKIKNHSPAWIPI